jgi:hypothetical protein
MTTKEYLIPQTKRSRVRGTGPRRDKLPVFKKIGDLSELAVEELKQILYDNQQNDLGADYYGISQNVNPELFNFSDKYRQVLLQRKADDYDGPDVSEYAYTEWVDPPLFTMLDLEKYFKNIYRFRLAEMYPGHELNWHIDSDTSVICRAQICLEYSDSTLEFKTREGEYRLTMLPGEIWFINTGWSHRAVSCDKPKRSAIFGFHYEDLIDDSILQ